MNAGEFDANMSMSYVKHKAIVSGLLLSRCFILKWHFLKESTHGTSKPEQNNGRIFTEYVLKKQIKYFFPLIPENMWKVSL